MPHKRCRDFRFFEESVPRISRCVAEAPVPILGAVPTNWLPSGTHPIDLRLGKLSLGLSLPDILAPAAATANEVQPFNPLRSAAMMVVVRDLLDGQTFGSKEEKRPSTSSTPRKPGPRPRTHWIGSRRVSTEAKKELDSVTGSGSPT